MRLLACAACCFAASACLLPGGEAVAPAPPAPAATPVAFIPGLVLSADERTVLERLVGHAVAAPAKMTKDKLRQRCADAPEMFAWEEFPTLNGVLVAYEITGDNRHLDAFRDSMALFLDLLEAGDDGFQGWWGKPIKPRQLADKPDLRIDEIQMSFRAISIMSRWIDLARRQSAYATANAAVIDRYLKLMEEHLVPKWDKRGFFIDLGANGGTYRGLDYPLCNPKEPGVTLSHEKISLIVDGLLNLHRVTGNSAYLRRAIQLGTRFKRCLSLKDGHYEWMSWEPGGVWDAHPTKEDAWRIGWIAPDPNGGWYAAAVSIAVSLYQHGLVFTDEDLARFLATQKTKCWNGDLKAPKYATVAGTASDADNKYIKGRFLSVALALYDTDLSVLAFTGPHEAEKLAGSTNAWKGMVQLEPYVRAKYLVRPLLASNPRPFARAGEAFLADAENRAFYDKLAFAVVAPGCVTPLKPSQLAR